MWLKKHLGKCIHNQHQVWVRNPMLGFQQYHTMGCWPNSPKASWHGCLKVLVHQRVSVTVSGRPAASRFSLLGQEIWDMLFPHVVFMATDMQVHPHSTVFVFVWFVEICRFIRFYQVTKTTPIYAVVWTCRTLTGEDNNTEATVASLDSYTS